MDAKITDMQQTISAAEYIDNFRDEARFFALCKECGNFGRLWACPPFSDDMISPLRAFSKVTVFVTKIEPCDAHASMSDISEIFRVERRRIEPRLREMEAFTGGRAFAFAGECLYCPKGECTREKGEPCRHPELVRPSLEAVGFDIGKTTELLFGLPLLWSGPDGTPPAYYLLTTALFHNTPVSEN